MSARCIDPRLGALLLALPLAAAGCGDPDQFLPPGQAGGPKGVLDGTVTYSGPLPCTENNHVIGAAVLLVFDVRALPPPEGLGTSAASLATVGGDELFAGVRGRLTFKTDKTRWCPAASTPPVIVSASFAAAPLDAGNYQIRGFYDYDGDFDPVFSIANLPTKGDIGGGAIDNAAEVLLGKPPRYREIALGALKNGVRVIPPDGARIGGIAVTLALPLPLERPIFFPKAVKDMTPSPAPNTDPFNVKMPSDFQLETFSTASPANTEKSFIRLVLGAGVALDEADVASKKPFNLPTVMPPPFMFYTWQDANGDGKLDKTTDHVPDSDQIPSLFPLSIFTLLSDGSDLVRQPDPTVVMQGLTLYKSLFDTALSAPTLSEPLPEAIVALRPAALCLPADPKNGGVLVITHKTDKNNNLIVADEGALSAALSAQFHRPVTISYGCLPQGRYAMNLVYGTGQAWTVPNEAGVCAKSEPMTADGKTCCTMLTADNKSCIKDAPQRPRLASQGVVLTVDKPTDATYCKPLPEACTVPPKPASK